MGVSKEFGRFSQFGWLLRGITGSPIKEAKTPKTPQVDYVSLDHEVREDDSFDAADAMERGVSNQMTTSYVEPQPHGATRRRMKVVRSDDRLRHTLYNEDGCVVLTAHTLMAEKRVDFFMGDGPSAKKRAKGQVDPAFAMTFDDSHMRWRLGCNRCESCVYRARHCSCEHLGGQSLANIEHLREEIGGGVAMCMEVDIPEVTGENKRAVWCPVKESREGLLPRRATELSSKRPTWNARLKSLVMDFKGRCDQASAKNFQLCKDDNVILMFGKRGATTFCLDFEHPLSTVQAFAASLSTMFWT